tara:strand:- start:4154 stop:5326 length:1173 start_codon:yes stop_codon:yes gene_type:complete
MFALFRAALAAAVLLAPAVQAQSVDLDTALAAVREQVDMPGFSGSVVVLQDGVPIYAEARGMADAQSGRANTLETRFNIASVGKFLTALGYLRAAAEAGIVDPAGLHPATLLGESDTLVTADLTMGDLMAHRTTAQSFFGAPDGETRTAAAQSNADIFVLVREAQAAPIARREDGLAYNNSNAIITGEIIARLTGESYEAAMQRLVFDPSGASSAAFARQAQAEALDLARPYLPEGYDPEVAMRRRPDGPTPSDYPVLASDPLSGSISMAAGGLYISAGDLARIGAAALDGGLVSPDQLEMMCTSQVERYGLIFGMGCGGRVFGPGQRRWGHNGGAPGVNAELALFPDQNIVLAVVANHHMRATPVLEAFEAGLFGLGQGGSENGFIVRH